MKNIVNRLRELCQYDPSKGIIDEAFGDVDTNGWICVGEVPFYPWSNKTSQKNKTYIMVNPKKEIRGDEEYNDVRYTENPDGSGKQTDFVPPFEKERQIIYPQHQDDEFGEIFLGKRENKNIIEQKHKEFASKLFIIDDNVVLHHNSTFLIRDGFVKKGKSNIYSNNTDIGIYFWASRNSGKDQSSYNRYSYYCLIPKEILYDFETNEERLTLPNAMSKYDYCGQYWKNGEAIVVTTHKNTPIWSILDKNTGRWYDSEWNEIEKPF